MKVDVSEIKQFRHCQRKWQFTSRNQFHLTTSVPFKAFKIGTVFHESLHRLYIGKPIEAVEEYIMDEMKGEDEKDIIMLRSMARGYAREVLPADMKKFYVVDIEYHFSFGLWEVAQLLGLDLSVVTMLRNLKEQGRDIQVVGSIDQIAIDRETNEVWGFEHKTAKSFRKEVYSWMDEQPRLYYIALMLWVQKYNADRLAVWAEAQKKYPKPQPVTVGGVYINEVKKLVRAFDSKRTPLTYPESDIRNFMLAFIRSVAECACAVEDPNVPRIPQPDFMTCSTCQFNLVCEKYKYADVKLEDILAEFSNDYKVRDADHLEDKNEVTVQPPQPPQHLQTILDQGK